VASTVPPEQCTAALGAIDAVISQALTLDGARYATTYNFVRALKRRTLKVPAALQAQAVQLLTVHGAKGLEADVVFIMDADPTPQNPETATLLIDWPVESAHPLRCAFVYSESRVPSSLESVLAREQDAREREELNGLYVAMTRARERIVFSATQPNRLLDRPSWWQRVQLGAKPLDEAAVATPAQGEAPSRVLRQLPTWAGGPGPSLASPRAKPADDAASRLGQAVHRVLEWAAATAVTRSAEDLPTLADAAAREFKVDEREVQRIAQRIWQSADCARFFRGPDLQWAGNEVPVSEGADLLRIDRLVRLGSGAERAWWVLDYKLRQAPGELQACRDQLLRYRRAVQVLQPGDEVRCAFITGAGEVIELS